MSQSKGRRWRQTAPKQLVPVEKEHLRSCWIRWLRGFAGIMDADQASQLNDLGACLENTGSFTIRTYGNFTLAELYYTCVNEDNAEEAELRLVGIGVTKRCGVHIEWRPFKDCAPRPMLAVPGVYTGTFSKERIGDEHNTAQAEQIACSAAIYDAFDRAIEGGA